MNTTAIIFILSGIWEMCLRCLCISAIGVGIPVAGSWHETKSDRALNFYVGRTVTVPAGQDLKRVPSGHFRKFIIPIACDEETGTLHPVNDPVRRQENYDYSVMELFVIGGAHNNIAMTRCSLNDKNNYVQAPVPEVYQPGEWVEYMDVSTDRIVTPGTHSSSGNFSGTHINARLRFIYHGGTVAMSCIEHIVKL